MLLVDARVGPSSRGGLGLFALEFVPKGSGIWEATPELDVSLSEAQLEALPERARRTVEHYARWEPSSRSYYLCFDDTRFLNHSDDPNTDCHRALRDIAPGDELTCRYRSHDLRFEVDRSLDGASVRRLAESLKDSDRSTRYQAAKSLTRAGREAGPAVPALAAALSDEDAGIRYYVAKSLSKIGPEAKEAVPALVAALEDGDPRVRYYCAKALGGIGASAVAASEPLRAALQDAAEEVREAAAQALKRIQGFRGPG